MQQIDGYTKTCGLIGCPVEHTLSPLIHNTIARRMGHNMVYVPFHVEPKNLEAAIEGAHALSLGGLNVTVPHKSDVIPYLKEIDPLAKKIGAVNTLVPVEGGFKGYNTDMIGLQRAMEADGIRLENSEAIVLGAGGVARAVAFMLVENGVERVYLCNRSLDRAYEVADDVNDTLEYDKVIPLPLNDYESIPEGKYICIQATSVGMYPNVEDALVDCKELYDRIEVAVDLIYKPSETRFMKFCKKAGVKEVHNGLKMLLFQGITAYELWNNVKVDDKLSNEIYNILKEATKVE